MFPISNITDISANLRHQEEFHRGSFPSAWQYNATGTLAQVSRTGSQYGSGSVGQLPSAAPQGSVMGGGQELPSCIPIAANMDDMSGLTPLPPPAGTSPFKSPPPPQSTGTQASWTIRGLNTDAHPTIAAVTMLYLQKAGKLQLMKVMTAAGVEWKQMSIIPKYVNTQGEN